MKGVGKKNLYFSAKLGYTSSIIPSQKPQDKFQGKLQIPNHKPACRQAGYKQITIDKL